MPFSIQVKYAENKYKKGDVVCVRPDGFQYSEGDCMREWLKADRNIDDYRNTFSITYCTNIEMDGTEPEVQELLKPHNGLESSYQRQFYILVPEDYNNVNRKELRETGETRATWATIQSLIGVRP